jgi:hypothetical protein
MNNIHDTEWPPERKVVAAAIATLVMAVIQLSFPDLEIPIGVEGSIAVIVAYLIPN